MVRSKLAARVASHSGPRMTQTRSVRLGADIGGTFTDVVLDVDGRLSSMKLLTDYAAPEAPILRAAAEALAAAGLAPSDLTLVVHGTTLATNALIERRGARTAFVTTEGFRDVLEMRTESRFDQYDLDIRLPEPLIPRERRFPVRGRIGAQGQELAALDEAALEALAERFAREGYESIAVGFLHSYMNPAHERRARDILARRLDVPISLSCEVSPQMREYERFNTVCANAYVRPRMADYLGRLSARLGAMGVACPVVMIHSGGGLVSLETAAAFPVRLVESGPAGGAIFAADVARRFGLRKALSYDMGGTTAKICLIGDYEPRAARSFEVARTTRFAKGSGMPISIPVIEMIEIGAGGGSLARVDAMGRIRTGPESAGSEPGPACYGRGGTRPAVTDADLALGRIDAANFAGGAIPLSLAAARTALARDVGAPLGLDAEAAAFGVCEVVDETMANAARVHAVENGEAVADHVMIAFGGAAPLHAARLCEKLGVDRCLVPQGAGVGSAIGFLRAPFAYEAVSSRLKRLSDFDAGAINALVGDLRETAEGFVREGAQGPVRADVVAFMRYAGQGWEIPVALPDRAFVDKDATEIGARFRDAYARFFGRAIDALGGLDVEIVSVSVKAQEETPPPPRLSLDAGGRRVAPPARRPVFDAAVGAPRDHGVFARDVLAPGDRVEGPAIIVERETATLVATSFDAVVQSDGALLLLRRETAT
jgi:N-methylhydantoinase A